MEISVLISVSSANIRTEHNSPYAHLSL